MKRVDLFHAMRAVELEAAQEVSELARKTVYSQMTQPAGQVAGPVDNIWSQVNEETL